MLRAESLESVMARVRPVMSQLTLAEQGLFLRCLLFATPDGWGSSEWTRMSDYALSMTQAEIRPILVDFAKRRLIRIYAMPEEAKSGGGRHYSVDSRRNLPKYMTPTPSSAWNPASGTRAPRKFLWRLNYI